MLDGVRRISLGLKGPYSTLQLITLYLCTFWLWEIAFVVEVLGLRMVAFQGSELLFNVSDLTAKVFYFDDLVSCVLF